MKRSLFCSLIISIGSVLGAEPALMTIEEIVTEALQKNPELSFYQVEINAAQARRRQAGKLPNPELSADVGQKRSRGADLAAEGLAWSVTLQQSFEFPGRIGLRKAIANREIELAELGLGQFKASLASRIRELAFELHIAQKRAETASVIQGRSRELMDVLLQRDPAGLTPMLETRILEASALKLRADSLSTETKAQAALMELNQLRGEAISREIRIANMELRFPDLPTVDELLGIAATNNFLLRIRQAELVQQGFQVDLARNERWPSIQAGPFYSQERAGEKEEIIGLGVSIPVPLWSRNQAAIATSEARLSQARTALQVAQREVERELREHYLTYSVYARQLRQWRTNILEELGAAAELGDRHYRLGAIPVSTYVELQEKFAEGMQAVLETQAAGLQSLQRLEQITGIPLGARGVIQSKEAP